MFSTSSAGNYRALLADHVVARTFGLALVGRLGYAVFPLSFLFTIRQATGSFAVAATGMAVFGVTALAMPLQARLADRHGQRRVLPLYGAAFVAALGALVVLAQSAGGQPVWWWVLSAALGVSAPALGPSMRAHWRRFTAEGPARTAAYSLDAVCEEVLYLVGPILAAAVLASGPAWRGLALAGLLVSIGIAGLAFSPVAADPEVVGRQAAPAPGHRVGALSPGLARLLAVMALFGATTALLFTGVAARADAVGHPEWAGYVETGLGLASVAGGLAWGRREHRRRWPAQLAALFALIAAAVVLAAAQSSWWVLGAALLGAGVATSPIYATAYLAADAETPPHRRTEVSTWVSTVTNLGNSAGTAAAGLAAAQWDADAPLWLAAGPAAAAAIALALWAARARARAA